MQKALDSVYYLRQEIAKSLSHELNASESIRCALPRTSTLVTSRLFCVSDISTRPSSVATASIAVMGDMVTAETGKRLRWSSSFVPDREHHNVTLPLRSPTATTCANGWNATADTRPWHTTDTTLSPELASNSVTDLQGVCQKR